jgi:hypothetical protein
LNFGKEYLWDQKLRQLGITWGHTWTMETT